MGVDFDFDFVVSRVCCCCTCTGILMINTRLEKIEKAIQKYVTRADPSPHHQAESSASGSLHLRFKGVLPETLYTNEAIEEGGASITVELCDDSGNKVESDPESPLRVKIDVLQGDFKVEDSNNDLTGEIYKKNVVSPREDKEPLLKKNSEVLLSGGSASISGISFTDNSKSMRNGKFRFGAQVINGGMVVKPAVSKSFKVKEGRLKADRKKEIPSPEDELWRLNHISKTGVVYKRALENNVRTVKDFLQLYHTDAKKMQSILGVPGKNWKAIVKHAEACKLTNKRWRYDDTASVMSLSLDCAFNIISVLFKGQMSQPFESLDDFLKEEAYKLRRTAYEKRNELILEDFASNQITIPKEPANTFSVQLQEKEQQQPGPTLIRPNSTDPNVHRHELPSTDSYDFLNLLHLESFTYRSSDFPLDQGDPVMLENLLNGWSECFGGDQTECNTTSPEFIQTAQMGERKDDYVGSVHGHATRKLLTACYVTRAATLFMITVQEDLSAPKKKRKLQ
ncbi:unnamed protein product [Amaranthus hypochondriacus]